MSNSITTKGLKAGSLFKIIFFGLLFSLGPLIIILGLFSLFGYDTIYINGEPVTGIWGLGASIIMAPIFAAIFASFNWLFVWFGLWVTSWFKAMELHYKPAHKDD